MIRLHGTCVLVAEVGVLLRGPPGAGKSDLALRLIDGGAELVADDQVEIDQRGEQLIAGPPSAIAGLLEVRGFGIVRLAYRAPVPLGLVIDLAPASTIERMPEPEVVDLLGHSLPHLALDAREPSAAAKVRLALRAQTGAVMRLR